MRSLFNVLLCIISLDVVSISRACSDENDRPHGPKYTDAGYVFTFNTKMNVDGNELGDVYEIINEEGKIDLTKTIELPNELVSTQENYKIISWYIVDVNQNRKTITFPYSPVQEDIFYKTDYRENTCYSMEQITFFAVWAETATSSNEEN